MAASSRPRRRLALPGRGGRRLAALVGALESLRHGASWRLPAAEPGICSDRGEGWMTSSGRNTPVRLLRRAGLRILVALVVLVAGSAERTPERGGDHRDRGRVVLAGVEHE